MNLKSKKKKTFHPYIHIFISLIRPVSPYALFFRDTQNDIKKKLPNPSFG
jgi:hypothetical protein